MSIARLSRFGLQFCAPLSLSVRDRDPLVYSVSCAPSRPVQLRAGCERRRRPCARASGRIVHHAREAPRRAPRGVGSQTKPLTPSSTSSAGPPLSRQVIDRLARCERLRGHEPVVLLERREAHGAAARQMIDAARRRSDRPAKVMRSRDAERAASACSGSRSSPSPAITARTSAAARHAPAPRSADRRA